LSEEAKDRIRGVDVLILDGLQPDSHWTHLSIGESIDLSRELEIGETWLTHFSCRANYAALEPGFPDGVRMAWDGLRLEV
jgi:phosphoribosyl 1,2-cyclic phosphate phosphodiesterase